MALAIFLAGGSAMTGRDFLRLYSHERHRKLIVFTSTLILVFSFTLTVCEACCFHLYLNFIIFICFLCMENLFAFICTWISLFLFAFCIWETCCFYLYLNFIIFIYFSGMESLLLLSVPVLQMFKAASVIIVQSVHQVNIYRSTENVEALYPKHLQIFACFTSIASAVFTLSELVNL